MEMNKKVEGGSSPLSISQPGSAWTSVFLQGQCVIWCRPPVVTRFDQCCKTMVFADLPPTVGLSITLRSRCERSIWARTTALLQGLLFHSPRSPPWGKYFRNVASLFFECLLRPMEKSLWVGECPTPHICGLHVLSPSYNLQQFVNDSSWILTGTQMHLPQVSKYSYFISPRRPGFLHWDFRLVGCPVTLQSCKESLEFGVCQNFILVRWGTKLFPSPHIPKRNQKSQ